MRHAEMSSDARSATASMPMRGARQTAWGAPIKHGLCHDVMFIDAQAFYAAFAKGVGWGVSRRAN